MLIEVLDNDMLYENIRVETEKFAEEVLSGLPDNFTMMHLECLKAIVPEQIDDRLSRLKMRTKLC